MTRLKELEPLIEQYPASWAPILVKKLKLANSLIDLLKSLLRFYPFEDSAFAKAVHDTIREYES